MAAHGLSHGLLALEGWSVTHETWQHSGVLHYDTSLPRCRKGSFTIVTGRPCPNGSALGQRYRLQDLRAVFEARQSQLHPRAVAQRGLG